MDLFVLLLSIPAAFAALAMVYGTFRTLSDLDILADVSPDKKSFWPSISLISPACNEEENIEASIQSVLSSDYPALEVVVVNDRSTDRTPVIIDALAKQDARVRSIHLKEIPANWLGKLNAMAQGVAVATGDWLLFADADVLFAPQALKKAIHYAESHQLDYLSMVPEIKPADFLCNTVFNVSFTAMCAAARPWAVRDPKSDTILGVGAFLLLRKSAYDLGPGLEWMRLEVADDQVMCALIKWHGGRCDVVNGRGEVGLQWYGTLREMNSKMQKGFFACIAQFSLLRGLLIALLMVYGAFFPFLSLLPASGWVRCIPVGILAVITLATLVSNWWARRP